MVEELLNRTLQLGDAAVRSSLDLPLGEQAEPSFDLVQPGAGVSVAKAGSEQVVGKTRRLEVGGLAGPRVVQVDVHVLVRRHLALDSIEELAELDGAMSASALADDVPGRHVKSGKQGRRPVPLVVVRGDARPVRAAGATRAARD